MTLQLLAVTQDLPMTKHVVWLGQTEFKNIFIITQLTQGLCVKAIFLLPLFPLNMIWWMLFSPSSSIPTVVFTVRNSHAIMCLHWMSVCKVTIRWILLDK